MSEFKQPKQFPEDFVFGVADADLQVIGEKHTITEENACPTMWAHFAKHSGKCHENETPLPGIDRYHRWHEDSQLIAQLGVSAYRTSLSMSRLMTAQGQLNSKAVQWYQQYFQALLDSNIKIYATLYHWELPQFLNEKGGWTNRQTVDWFVNHALNAMEAFSEQVQDFFVLNEPWCASILSYYLGVHAPGGESIEDAILAAHHLLLAQGIIVREAKAKFPELRIGTVYNVQSCYAASTSQADRNAQQTANTIYNDWFFEPTYLGRYPQKLLALYGDHFHQFSQSDLDTMRVGHLLDYHGINYYHGSINQQDSTAPFGFNSIVNKTLGTNDLGWPIFTPPHYPEGFYDILTQLYDRYSEAGLKNILITENGMALSSNWKEDEPIVEDQGRMHYFHQHLAQVYKALTRGVPVTGFFAWTLMDNYEWAEGYRPESTFGLIHVDRESFKRIPKQSYYWYQSVAQTGLLKPPTE